MGRAVARLVAIGLIAGVFSSLFGVGGGIVVVPLLLLAASYTPHAATATSLGAILLTSIAGATLYAFRGEVRPGYAALLGLPAVVGAIGGAHLQQRLSGRALTLSFAALMAVIGGWLILG